MTAPTIRRFLSLAMAVSALAFAPAKATTLLERQELPALVAESERALVAEVVQVRFGKDDRGLHSTWIDLAVEERLYGRMPGAGDTITLKLYGAPITMPDGSRIFIEGTPSYRQGERYLLLLRGESEWGFTNVAGLMLGAFRIEAGGRATTARSLGGNRAVFGADGLQRWLPGGERMTPGERRALETPDAAVPIRLLRKAVIGLRAANGGGR